MYYLHLSHVAVADVQVVVSRGRATNKLDLSMSTDVVCDCVHAHFGLQGVVLLRIWSVRELFVVVADW